ncbi:MAG TPA: RES domain-containing protein, partial [Chitinophagaceae bacterium]|nr:RES domain-containing protein [Chitinophagaceae bacterium]
MELYRITQEQYANDLSGNGARLFGGRWNSEGLFAIYSSSTRALALLETLAHTPGKMMDQRSYSLITLSVPNSMVAQEIVISSLGSGWDSPDTSPLTKKM